MTVLLPKSAKPKKRKVTQKGISSNNICCFLRNDYDLPPFNSENDVFILGFESNKTSDTERQSAVFLFPMVFPKKYKYFQK